MKKTLLAMGIAAIAMTSAGAGAQASVKHAGFKHHRFHHHWGYHQKHFWGGRHKCFWVKKKRWGHKGWYWKTVYVCKPWWDT